MEEWEMNDLIEIKNNWKKLAQEQVEKLERIKTLVIECDADNRVPQPYEILDIIND